MIAADVDAEGRWKHSRYEAHYSYLWSEWVAVFVLLLFWGVITVIYNVVIFYDSFQLPERRANLISGEDGEASERSRLIRDAPREQPVKSAMARRFSRAEKAARTALLMLLAVVTFTSLPLPYACTVPSQTPTPSPSPPIPPLPRCSTCLQNAATLPAAIISWIVAALGAFLVVIESVAAEGGSVDGARAAINGGIVPLIVGIVVVGMWEWASIRRMGQESGCA
ncbi:hypothetical protein BDK51DRAFT_28584 [Blyttiomyces helicus]|uniref:Uncharacterized protein n=1 Tax=Blyttiomyces helicus TaxID=388810 RepID=A0A4P9WK82_9FUNG|nr:hypothetical protein BDK51DRAFT_28584 [Blyttiomyces helicus]|eukprot:RKO92802.1 hypothetical protein BDK51DRAFT_28584 [Blyttiomyces helicus]